MPTSLFFIFYFYPTACRVTVSMQSSTGMSNGVPLPLHLDVLKHFEFFLKEHSNIENFVLFFTEKITIVLCFDWLISDKSSANQKILLILFMLATELTV